MSSRIVLATLVAISLSVNLAVAQESTANIDQFSSTNFSSQLNFSADKIDAQTAQQIGSTSATLFKTDDQSTMTAIGAATNAQQEVVSNTLLLIGTGSLIGLIVIGAFLYSSQRDIYGAKSRRNW